MHSKLQDWRTRRALTFKLFVVRLAFVSIETKPEQAINRTTGRGGFLSLSEYLPMSYHGSKMAKTIAAAGRWKIEIVKRSDLHRFVVLPKRWIVERTFAWINRNRRLARDFERYATTVAAFIRLAGRLPARPAHHKPPYENDGKGQDTPEESIG
jgi:hypothetical protein